MEIEELKEKLKNTLSSKRFNHCLGVMERCEELAKRFNVDVEKAKKVGLCHDIAKEMPESEKIKYINEHSIQIDKVEEKNIGLLHAKIGADIAKK